MHETERLQIVTTSCADHSVLKNVAMDLTFPLSKEVHHIINRMKNHILAEKHDKGYFTVGLSAPQVGYPIKLFFYQIPEMLANKYNIEPLELSLLINTGYIPTSKSCPSKSWEGCLSVCDQMGEACRFSEIEYTGFDINGVKITKIVSGVLAQIIQHEIDHTYGIMFTDKIPSDGRIDSIDFPTTTDKYHYNS